MSNWNSFDALLVLTTFLIGLCGSTSNPPMTIYLVCDFKVIDDIYQCLIENLVGGIDINEEHEFIILGEHLPGYSNFDVKGVEIIRANVPLVVPKLFDTFPNVVTTSMQGNYELIYIKTDAFPGSEKLLNVQITGNKQLKGIYHDAFSGAPNIQILNLSSNALYVVEESGFTGLSSLKELYLSNNRFFPYFDEFVLAPLVSLKILVARDNILRRLGKYSLTKNIQLELLDLSSNGMVSCPWVNFSNKPNLTHLILQNNQCINKEWIIDGVEVTWEMVYNDLNERRCLDAHQQDLP